MPGRQRQILLFSMGLLCLLIGLTTTTVLLVDLKTSVFLAPTTSTSRPGFVGALLGSVLLVLFGSVTVRRSLK